MRKGIISFMTLLLSLVGLLSCESSHQAEENFVQVKFLADINVGESNVFWENGDAVSIYNGKVAPVNKGTKFTCTSSKGATKSITFQGFLQEASVFYAATPYKNVLTWASDGTPSFSFEIKSRQTAYESGDGINEDENIFVAKTSSPKGRMSFCSAYPLLKFSFNLESPLVSSIVIESASGKFLGGKYSCKMDSDELVVLTHLEGGQSNVTLSSFDGECPFVEGSYYIGLAPGEYPEGDLTVTYNYTNGKSWKTPLALGQSLVSGEVYDCGLVEATEVSGGGTVQNPPLTKIEDTYDIYLCIGQSNMAGRGYLLSSDLNKSIPNVFLLNSEGKPVEATHPFNQYSTIRKDLSMQQMHLGYSFSLMMTNEPGSRPVLLVCNARGGTSITEWGKGSDYYVEAVNRTLLAMQYGTLKGILWHQGCADSSKRVNEYMGLLSNMITSLRSDLGVADLPVVVGELPYWRSTSGAFNVMINQVSDNIAKTACVSADGCGMRADVDDPHFSREGLNIIGKRYAEAMKKLLNK